MERDRLKLLDPVCDLVLDISTVLENCEVSLNISDGSNDDDDSNALDE
jgi:hypothetical protein